MKHTISEALSVWSRSTTKNHMGAFLLYEQCSLFRSHITDSTTGFPIVQHILQGISGITTQLVF